jgi:hypothetical protein
MKTTVNSNSILKTIAITATVLLFAGSPLSSFAGNGKEKHKNAANEISESQMDVQYTGSDKNGFIFSVKFENSEAKKFTLIIRNDDGEIVYSKDFNDVHFARTIRLVKDQNDTADIQPTFSIAEGGELVQQSFSIDK